VKIEARGTVDGSAATGAMPLLPGDGEPAKLEASGAAAGGSFKDMQQPAKVELPRNSPLSSPCSVRASPEASKLPLGAVQRGLDFAASMDGSAPSPPPAHLPSVPLRLSDALTAAPPAHSPLVPLPVHSPLVPPPEAALGFGIETGREGTLDYMLPDVPALPLLHSPLPELSSLPMSPPPALPGTAPSPMSASAVEMAPPGLAQFMPMDAAFEGDFSSMATSHMMMSGGLDSSDFGKLQLPLGHLASEDAFAVAFNLGRCAEMFDHHQVHRDVSTPASYQFETPLAPGWTTPLGSPIDDVILAAELGLAPGLPPPLPGSLPLGSPMNTGAAADFGLAHGLAPPLPIGSQSCEKMMLHSLGKCRPCAWFWKAAGCQNGMDCSYCHFCPAGEIKARKKANQTMMQLGLATPQTRPKSDHPRTTTDSVGEPVKEADTPRKLTFFMTEQEPAASCPSASPRSEHCTQDGIQASSSDQESTTGAESEVGVASSSDPDAPNTTHSGSQLHGTGNCKPCAWFWKPVGCQKDKQCSHCHLCPEGERKQRKKSKMFMMRSGTSSQKSEQNSDHQGTHSLSLASLL